MDIFDKYNEDKLNTLENRITAGLKKLNNETDASWKELVEDLDLDIHPDEFRKRAYGYQEFEYVYRNMIMNRATREEIEQLNDKLIELKKERAKVSDLRNQVNRKLRESARKDNMFELAKDLVKCMDSSYPLLPGISLKNDGINEAVLMLSDWHIGIDINNSWNVFNLEVFYERIATLLYHTVENCKLNKVKKIHMVFMGDIISGLIHTTIRIENRENVVKQTLIASEVISEMIEMLSRNFEIDVHFTVGNHDRVMANKFDSLDGENFGYLMKYMIELRTKNLRNVNITSNKVDDELITFESLGWKIVATHGDKFGKKTNIIDKLTSMLKYVPDYVLMGHLHQHYESTTGEAELIINPTLSGVDTYAKNLGLIGRPAQKLLIINEKVGKYCTYNIYLDK